MACEACVFTCNRVSSMQIWVVGLLCEEDLLTRVPKCFPTREDAEYVSEFLHQPDFEKTLVIRAASIRKFVEQRMRNCITGEQFFRKMKKFVEDNRIVPNYIPK